MSRAKKIVLAGGGSGGHLTPLLAVGSALKEIDNETVVVHVGQKGESLQNIVEHASIDHHFSISAGKFRRYHGESFLQHIIDINTIALNVRDFFKFLVGVLQAWILLGKVKPDAVFLKGGFVCVPVGYAARLRNIPYITHDSDAVPGLANKLTAKHARYNTTAMQPNIYPYEATKTIQVGIPVQSEFSEVSNDDKQKAKQALGLHNEHKVVFSVGGGLGARTLNEGVVHAVNELVVDKDMRIIHLTGKALFQETRQLYESTIGSEKFNAHVLLKDFSTELYRLSAAADVVITRAGATNIAEFALQAKPCVVVPAPHLTGGQQLHNADVLMSAKAAIVLQEADLPGLAGVVRTLLNDKKLAYNYARSIHQFAVHDSAQRIAQLLIDISEQTKVDAHEVSA